MTKLESIRKTFVPPIVATIIVMGLVSDWSSAGASVTAVAPDASPGSVTHESRQKKL